MQVAETGHSSANWVVRRTPAGAPSRATAS